MLINPSLVGKETEERVELQEVTSDRKPRRTLQYATYICDDNGYRDADDRHIFYRLHAIHYSEESARAEIRRHSELSLWTPEKSAEAERWEYDRKLIPLSTIAMSMREDVA